MGSIHAVPAALDVTRQQSLPAAAASTHDERPAVAQGAGDASETGGIIATTKGPVAVSGAVQPIEGPSVPQWQVRLNKLIVKLAGDQPRAEVLSGPKAAEAKDYATELGEYAAACLFSKRWQLREAAVKALSSKEGFAAASEGCSNLSIVLLRYFGLKTYGVQESIATVFFCVCDAVSALLRGSLAGAASPQSMANEVTLLLPELMMKAGDNNNRVREQAATVLTDVAHSAIGSERVATAALAEPENATKRPLNHRVHVARIHIVTLLLEEVGLATKDRRTGLTVDGIMTKLVLPSLQHSHQDVREGALSLIVLLHQRSSNVAKFFGDLKPAQRALVEERIGTSKAEERSPAASKGKANVTRRDEQEMVSSSFTVEKGQENPVLAAARKAKEQNEAAAAAKPSGKQSKPKPAQPSEEELAKTCQFCLKYDTRFNEQVFYQHYLRTCPVLCPCPLCGQVTEISNLQHHIVFECEHKDLVKQCPRCKEAVRAEDLDEHVKAKSCIAASSSYAVCPLCHEKLPPTEKGWRAHLTKDPGCVNNARRFDGGDGEEFLPQ